MTPNETAVAFRDRADELAAWALPRFFDRLDRAGGYVCIPDENGKASYHPINKPKKRPPRDSVLVDLKHVARHFRGRDGTHIMGAHSLAPGTSLGRKLGLDYDAHDGTDFDPAANEKFALHVHDTAAGCGFRPILYPSDGKGGFHTYILFNEPVPGVVLQTFGHWLVRDHAAFGLKKVPEIFPKQSTVPEDGYGNWMRLPGRHYKREFWPTFWAGGRWVAGDEAVTHLLSVTGDDPRLIPAEALEAEGEDGSEGPGRPRGAVGPAGGVAGSDKPGADFNLRGSWAETGLFDVAGFAWVRELGPERGAVVRPGKGSGISGTVGLFKGRESGFPLFRCFTTNAPPFEPRSYNRFAVYAMLHHGGDFRAAARELGRLGYGRVAPRVKFTSSGRNGPPDAGPPPAGPSPTEPPSADPPHPGREGDEGGGGSGPSGSPKEEDGELPRSWDDPRRLAELALAGRGRLVCLKQTWFEYVRNRYLIRSGQWVEKRCKEVAWREAEREWHRTAGKRNEIAEKLKGIRERIRDTPAADPQLKKLADQEAKTQKELDAATKKCGTVQKVTIELVRNIAESLRGLCQYPDDTQLNVWLTGAGPRVLAVANGLLDLDTLELRPPSDDWFSLVALPVKYDPRAAEPARFLRVFREITSDKDGKPDDDKFDLLMEVMGATLDPGVPFKHFVVLAGDTDTGKTAVQAVLRGVLGDDNVAAQALEDITRNQFGSWPLFGKLANLVDDQGFIESADEGLLRKLTGDGLTRFEQKGKDPFAAVNTAKLFFNCNTPPTFSDKSDAVWNRLVLMPCVYTIPKAKQDATLKIPASWGDEAPGILNVLLRALGRYRDNKHKLTFSLACDVAAEHHRIDSDPAREFFTEHYVPGGQGDQLLTAEMYRRYVAWCRATGNRFVLRQRQFGKQIKKAFPAAKPLPNPVTRATDKGQERGRAWQGIKVNPENPPPEPESTDPPRVKWGGYNPTYSHMDN